MLARCIGDGAWSQLTHVTHYYWEPGHGKGEHDGHGAVVKRQLRRSAQNGKLIDSAAVCVHHVNEHMHAPKPDTSHAHAARITIDGRWAVELLEDDIKVYAHRRESSAVEVEGGGIRTARGISVAGGTCHMCSSYHI